jgi:cytochrome P450
MINAIDKDQHRRKRRVIGRVFSDRSMRSFEPTLVGQINTFLQILFESSQSGASLEMSERCQRLAVDIVGHLAFGYPFDTQTKEVHRFLPKLLLGMTWRMNIYMQFPPIGSLEKLLAFIGVRKVLKVGNLVQTMIKSRLTKDADAYNDLFSYVANDIGKGQQGLYEGEVWPESMLFIIAGKRFSQSQRTSPVHMSSTFFSHEAKIHWPLIIIVGGTTTSTAMSSLFFYLSRNPSSYITLAAEIRSTFKSAEEIRSGPVLNSCKYLRACIDEALRMSPPTLTPMWRQQDARDGSDEPFVVDGHVIPPNTQVAVSLYSLNHNEEYFPDSFTFKPERWLDTSQCGGGDASEGGDSRANMRKAFAPFLMGDRSCAGKSMAYMEISLTLARTLWFFDFEPAPGKAGEAGGGTLGRKDGRGRPNEFQLEDAFAAIHHGPNLVFRERDKLWRERLREE